MPVAKQLEFPTEKVTLKDGRVGYFFQVAKSRKQPAIIKVVVRTSKSIEGTKKGTGQITKRRNLKSKKYARKSTNPSGQDINGRKVFTSIVKGLKEVKRRKSEGNLPSQDFDSLVDAL